MSNNKETRSNFQFEGFENPTTTPVPDVVFDRLLTRLGEAELKALLYIIRRTFGFKRDRDPISFNQFLRGITTKDGRVLDEGCGVRSRTTLSTALKSLEHKGIVVSEKGIDEQGENVTTVYRLRFKSSESEVVRNSYHRSTESALPVVRQTYPQQTVKQQTVQQQDDDDIRQALEVFGISAGQAQRLAETYPSALVLQRCACKLALMRPGGAGYLWVGCGGAAVVLAVHTRRGRSTPGHRRA